MEYYLTGATRVGSRQKAVAVSIIKRHPHLMAVIRGGRDQDFVINWLSFTPRRKGQHAFLIKKGERIYNQSLKTPHG